MMAPPAVLSRPQNEIPITDLSTTHAIKSALSEAGYIFLSDVNLTSPSELSAELNISVSAAEDVLQQCRNPPGPSASIQAPINGMLLSQNAIQATPIQSQAIQSSTAADLLDPTSLPRFSTLSETLDSLIEQRTYSGGERTDQDRESIPPGSGAIVPGMAVEIAGPPGIGKTSLAVGLALNARMGRRGKRRSSLRGGGETGEVLIIDAEGGISPDRLQRAAEAMTRNNSVSVRSLLDGIHLVRIATQVQMIAFLNLLDVWLKDHSKVNLIVIDSLSYHFRQPNLEISARRQIMECVKQQIGKATTVHHCAVVVATQMGTKSLSAEGKRVDFGSGEKVVLMPQLGGQWQTAKTLRVTLFRGAEGNEVRYAHVGTSADSDPNGDWACFDIDIDGLPTDVEG